MRCATVSGIKQGKRCRRELQRMPKAGSKIRDVYDLFQSHKGQPVEFRYIGVDPAVIVRLTDFYGLDIRRVQSGNSRTGRKSIYVLAGEWFGKVYVDYIAEHLASLEKRSAA